MIDPLRDSIKASGNYAPDATEFLVYVPDGVAGCPVQVEAPDGIILEIEMPESVQAGDVVNFQKTDEGQWIPHLTSSVPVAPELGLVEPPYGTAVTLSDGSCAPHSSILEEDIQIKQTEVDIASDGSVHVVVQQLRAHVHETYETLSQNLEEHQTRYLAEQDAILGRLETVEQFLQQMAPALQGLLDRFETEQAERTKEAQKMNEMFAGLQCEFSKQSELSQAKSANQEESIARLEAELTRLQENNVATSQQLGPLAVAAESKAADAQAVEQLLKLIDSERIVNSEKYVELEARLEAFNARSIEKIVAFESRVETISASAEQRENHLSQNLQALHANLTEHYTGFEQKLAEQRMNMTIGQRQDNAPSGGNSLDMDVITKRFEEEQARSLESLKQLELALSNRIGEEQSRNLEKVQLGLNKRIDDEQARTSESLKKLEVGLNSCKKNQTQHSEETTKLSSRVDAVERTSSSNVDRAANERSRIEAVETRLQAVDRIERELRNASVGNLALAQRLEKVEVAQGKEVAPSVDPEAILSIEKVQSALREDSLAMLSRLDAVESSVSKANSEASQQTAILSRLGAVEASMEKLKASPSANKLATATKAQAGSELEKVSASLKDTQARLTRSTKLPDEVIQKHSDLLRKLAQPPQRTPAKVLSSSADKMNAPPPPPRTRSVTPPRSPVPPPRYVEPSVSVKMEAPAVMPQQTLASSSNRSLTPTRRSQTPTRRSTTPPRASTPSRSGSFVASIGGSHVATMPSGSHVALAPSGSHVSVGASARSNIGSIAAPTSSPTNKAQSFASPGFGYPVAHERGRAASPRSEPLFLEQPVQSGGGSVRSVTTSFTPGASVNVGAYAPASSMNAGMQAEPLFTSGISTVSGTQVPTSNIRQAPRSGTGWWGS